MKILTCTAPGLFNYGEVEKPLLTSGKSILKIKRIGVCGTDIHAYEGTQPYFTYPRILGHELGCEFVEGDAEGFISGEKVTFIPYFHCGKCIACRQHYTNCCQNIQVAGVHTDGGMTEYLSVPTHSLVHGKDLELDSLALIEPLAVSAHGIRRAAVKMGEYVLIIGAGPIGIGAMKFASIAGAKVIAMDVNTHRLTFCQQKLHVDHVIQAQGVHVYEQIQEITLGDMPTVVIDATGSQKAIQNAFQYMAHTGRYVLIGLQKGDISFSHPEFHKREATLMSSRNATREDFEYVISCIRKKWIDPQTLITHRIAFGQVKDEFLNVVRSETVIKAMIEL
ncbi:MAG: zinc-binding alcohol dehydrogenase family protein [Microscillaceae bacterium]|nr:zinc-binding alcohol dehydrogenase family protein [Microscillaceae bacterium]